MKNLVKLKCKLKWQVVVCILTVLGIGVFYFGFIERVFSYRARMYFLVPLCLMAFLTTGFTYMAVKGKKYSYARLAVVLVITWGLIASFILPFMAFPDAANHYGTAYYASNKLLGVEDDEDGTMMRTSDILEDTRFYEILSVELYENIANGSWRICEDSNVIETSMFHLKCVERYIPSAVTISVLRILNVGASTLKVFSGLGNILFMAICAYLAVRILPVGRSQLVAFLMMPAFINIYSSVHYDIMSNSLCILFLAVCLRNALSETKMQVYDVLLMLILWALLIPFKGIYITFGVFIFMIPKDKWRILFRDVFSTKLRVITVAVMVVAIIVLFCAIGGKYIAAYINAMTSDYITEGGGSSYSVSKILQDPVKFLGALWFGFKYFFQATIPWSVGSIMGCLDIKTEKWICWMWLAILGATMLVKRRNGLEIKKFKWILIGIGLCFVLAMAGTLARFASFENPVCGLNGRYAMPMLFSFFIAAGTDAEENETTMSLYLLQHITTCVIMLMVVYRAINRGA